MGRSEVGWRLRLQPLAELIALLLDRLTREGSKLPPRRALFSVVLLHKYCVCVCARVRVLACYRSLCLLGWCAWGSTVATRCLVVLAGGTASTGWAT